MENERDAVDGSVPSLVPQQVCNDEGQPIVRRRMASNGRSYYGLAIEAAYRRPDSVAALKQSRDGPSPDVTGTSCDQDRCIRCVHHSERRVALAARCGYMGDRYATKRWI